MKYIKIVAAVIVASLLLTACQSTNGEEIRMPEIEENLVPDIIENYHNYSLERILLETVNGESDEYVVEAGSYAEVEDYILYSVESIIKMGNDSKNTKIIKLDKNSGISEIIYNVDHQEPSQGIVVMEGLGNKVYFVEKNLEWEIKELDVDTNEVKTITSQKTYPDEFHPNISIVGRYLVWYGIGDQNIVIRKYNLDNGSEEKIEVENLYLSTPHEKIPRSDRYILYVTKEDELIINQYDIENDSVIKVASNTNKITHIDSSGDYIIWANNWVHSDVFLYTFDENKIYSLFGKEDEGSLRSTLFVDDGIICDFSSAEFGGIDGGTVVFLNVEKNEMNIIYEPDEDGCYWLKESESGFSMRGQDNLQGYVYRFTRK